MQRADSLEKTLMLGEIEGGRRRGRQRMRWLNDITVFDGHEFEQTLGDSDGRGSLVCCSPWSHKESWNAFYMPSSGLDTLLCFTSFHSYSNTMKLVLLLLPFY